MQSKPGAKKVVYVTNERFVYVDRAPFRLGWSHAANKYDTDGTTINYFGGVGTGGLRSITFPDQNIPEMGYIVDEIAKKYELFDVNVTTSRSVYEAAANRDRVLCYIFAWPASSDFNSLKNDKTENGSLPYSFRRWLLGNMEFEAGGVLRAPGWAGYAPGTPHRYILKQINGQTICFARRDVSYMRFKLSEGLAYKVGGISGPENRLIAFQETASSAAHEIGHCYELSHDTRGGSPVADSFDSYYGGHDVWGPIMGNPIYQFGRTLIQWSTAASEMKSAYPVNTNQENDIVVIAGFSDFIKRVSKKIAPSGNVIDFRTKVREKLRLFAENCWDSGDNKLGYNVRLIKKSDLIQSGSKSYIQGMIGFPFDFDLLKIVLPKGHYTFSIDNTIATVPGTMFDPQIDVINCHCNKSKEDWDVSCDQEELPGIYPEDATTQCIAYDPCISETEYERSKEWGIDDGHIPVITSSIHLPYRSIIYLRIRGGKNLTPANGWGRYGSVGKYKLNIRKDNQPLSFSDLPSFTIPECHCKEFYYCDSGTNKKVILYVQDEAESKGSSNQSESYIKETTAIINGESKKTKFLVYGPSIGIDEPEEEGKFYLTIIENGECRKQEFVVGQDWEKKNNNNL